MLIALERSREPVNVFNLGTEEYCTVDESLGWISSQLGLDAEAALHGWRAGLDRRQPVHLPRHVADPGARLAAQAHDPRGRPADARLPACQPVAAAGAPAMKVAVYGLWHLGSVTAACLAAAGRQVVGLDLDEGGRERTCALGSRRSRSRASPTASSAGLASGRLRFTTRPAEALCGRRRAVGHLRHARGRRRRGRRGLRARPPGGRRRRREAGHPGARLVAGAGGLHASPRRGLEGPRAALRLLAGEPAARASAIESFEHAERVVVGARATPRTSPS